ncbi:uncharacterized protein F5891DRAFT_1181095 [Suillus fuscotomentosus]|uniref:Uncharacterized protein n=1 Tax=Suillus fuscotomentosus TaxID=1912939 RepID=A0AAD4ENH8_9AGAM|nr:uncharacterized protein F5891DRAFT_1181095 [Suillus fuscotomentosus]KAG1908073.1 hypothetical protein F5891DRAFT_1181095 [Suillus fuscotomentosus]
MPVPQDIIIQAGHRPKYAFLAHPPPPKKRPTQPLPSPPSYARIVVPQAAPRIRPRSNTFSTITAWAAHVQPGSPASLSPRSPRRRPSIGLRSQSIHYTPLPLSIATPQPPRYRILKPTSPPSAILLPFYSSLRLPFAFKPHTAEAGHQIPIPPVPTSPTRKSRGLTRLRSLSGLKYRGRSKSAAPSSPTKMKAKAAAASSAAVVKRKKANMESNIKRVMEAQARAGAPGVSDVYRDGEGGVWWDQDEEWEYAHLLAAGEDGAAGGMGDLGWVTFGGDKSSSANPDVDEERRGSVSTQDSDLDTRYIVQPTDHLDTDDLAVFGSALTPLATRKPAMSVLALPSRPRRAAKHLHKPDYLLNVAFSGGFASPKSPAFAMSACANGVAKPKGKARRRPAPLTLTPPSPALRQPSNSPMDVERTRKDFFESSFEPIASAVPSAPAMYKDERGKFPARLDLLQPNNSNSLSFPCKKTLAKKPSRLNMIGFFKSSKK